MYKTKLLPSLEAELQRVRARRNFDADAWIQKKAQTLNEYMAKCGLHGIVISVSGGIDSTVTAAMASFASQQKDSPIQRIILLQQPIHSTKSIVDRALLLKSLPNVEMVEYD